MVGNVDYGNYPPQAQVLPKVGGHSLDLEAVIALKPDLILGWESGNLAAATVARSRATRLTVHLSEPKRIEDIAGDLERIGKLAGTEPAAAGRGVLSDLEATADDGQRQADHQRCDAPVRRPQCRPTCPSLRQPSTSKP